MEDCIFLAGFQGTCHSVNYKYVAITTMEKSAPSQTSNGLSEAVMEDSCDNSVICVHFIWELFVQKQATESLSRGQHVGGAVGPSLPLTSGTYGDSHFLGKVAGDMEGCLAYAEFQGIPFHIVVRILAPSCFIKVKCY